MKGFDCLFVSLFFLFLFAYNLNQFQAHFSTFTFCHYVTNTKYTSITACRVNHIPVPPHLWTLKKTLTWKKPI